MNPHRSDASSSIRKPGEGLSLEQQRDELFSQAYIEMNAVLGEPEITGGNGSARSRTAIYKSPYLPDDRRVSAWIIRSYQEGPAYLMTQSLSADMIPDEAPIVHIGFSKEGKLYTDTYSDLNIEQMIKIGEKVLKTIHQIKNPEESIVIDASLEETDTIVSNPEPDTSVDEPQEKEDTTSPAELPKNISVPVKTEQKPKTKTNARIKKPARSIPTKSLIQPRLKSEAKTTVDTGNRKKINDKDVVADDTGLNNSTSPKIIEKPIPDIVTSGVTSLPHSSERKLDSPFERSLRRFLDGVSDDMPLISSRIEALRAERMVQDGAFAGDTYLREEVRDEIQKF